jgi:hypothetical protein
MKSTTSNQLDPLSIEIKNLFTGDWQQKLINVSKKNRLTEKYSQLLIDASGDMGPCIDPRPVLEGHHHGVVTIESPEAAEDHQDIILEETQVTSEDEVVEVVPDEVRTDDYKAVAGAAGFVSLGMMIGLNLDDAVSATQQLYKRMKWGQMKAHIDDDHSEIDLEETEELAQRRTGCGAERNMPRISQIMSDVMKGEMHLVPLPEDIGPLTEDAIENAEGELIVYTGSYDPNTAVLIVNCIPGKTINSRVLFQQRPTFVWDASATTSKKIHTAFTESFGTDISYEEYVKIQFIYHVATARVLGALHDDYGNLAVLGEIVDGNI